MRKAVSLLYSFMCYFVFFGTFLYTIGFAGNLVVSKTIDSTPQVPLFKAFLIDAALLLLFTLLHSIMLGATFKKWWTTLVSPHIARRTYVLLASLCLLLLMWQWQPIGGAVWSVENEMAKTVLHVTYLIGWAVVLVSIFLINHRNLFSMRQVTLLLSDKPYRSLTLRVPLFHRLVRYPLYVGFLTAFWSAPVMAAVHLLVAVLTTSYILTAILLEERNLQLNFERRYRPYKKKVPMIVPFGKPKAVKYNFIREDSFKRVYEEIW